MSEIRTLGRHAAIYALGTALAKLASFIMLPIYTRFLTPADYGVLELLSMTIDLIGMLTGATLTASVFPFYSEHKASGKENEVITTAAIGVTCLAVITAVAGMFVAPFLSSTVLGSHGNPQYFRLFFLIYITQTAEIVPFLMLRALHRSMLVVTLNLARLVGLLTLNVLFVVYFRKGVTGILYSNLIVSALVSITMMTLLFRTLGVSFSWSKFKQMARYAYPVAFVSLGNFFLVFSDRYFLNHFVGAAAVGVYSLAYRFGFMLSAFVFNPFQQIWGPQRFAIAKQPNAREVYRRVFLYVNIALGIGALVIALFVRDILKVMATHNFWGAYRVVPLILIAQILHHWTAYNNLGLFLTKTTKKFAWGSAVGIASVLLLNLLLIPRFGLWGAAIATVIAYVLRLVVIHELSQREYRINYDWARVFKLYAILIGAYVIRALVGDPGIVVSTTLGGTLVVLSSWAVFALILNAGERQSLVSLAKRKLLAWRRPAKAVKEAPPARETPVEVAAE
jgi:O-antigen/teichoic acid export membrane protein